MIDSASLRSQTFGGEGKHEAETGAQCGEDILGEGGESTCGRKHARHWGIRIRSSFGAPGRILRLSRSRSRSVRRYTLYERNGVRCRYLSSHRIALTHAQLHESPSHGRRRYRLVEGQKIRFRRVCRERAYRLNENNTNVKSRQLVHPKNTSLAADSLRSLDSPHSPLRRLHPRNSVQL
jgi:hypothetical protein